MLLEHIVPQTNGRLIFIHHEPVLGKDFKENTEREQLITIAFNAGETQQMVINGATFNFPQRSILPLVSREDFHFDKPDQITIWQYNHGFNCLTNATQDISCISVMFFGFSGTMFLQLDEDKYIKIINLLQMFREEFNTPDTVQSEMLQMLLKQLINITIRLAKDQYLRGKAVEEEKFDMIRKFNLLVDQHYKTEHQVQFYASALNRSPKTLSNLFALYKYRSPSQIIHERIVSEAKRQFYYTGKSSKEIAYELGFSDPAHFSRFFKNATKLNTTDFKRN
ncbi:helix-turn-helix domain-containing protein [Pedobacter aquatilis]|uniref:helix-turn-helix domain-containing protein n=1 Tax=Pedobacter aquatilis TaxID=351343 RepID=UPI00292E7DF9|nr:helix-turn-helix domain-containing protein [Pedobacter aquatilis]